MMMTCPSLKWWLGSCEIAYGVDSFATGYRTA
jgi:hypothetical protein